MELREIAAFLQVAQLKSFSKAARALGYSQAAVTIQIKQLEQELKDNAMELREIAAFLQVAQLKSFSKAARALGYSQAAVTIQIKQLEQELGIHLFDRIGKQTILTHQGMVFYDHAAAVMRQLKSFSKAARALGYSQAAVTIQIKQFEQELGIHLFDRSGQQTILTHQGMVCSDHAAAVMREISCARAAVTESQELTGALTIGTIESICASIFPDLMEAFHKATQR